MKNWTHWQPIKRNRVPAALRPWLMDQASLTRRLKAHNQHDFSVDLLSNSWMRALINETRPLAISPSELTYQREVRLLDGEHANVYARTIVPRATYVAMQYRFNNLGNTSLGELLFTDASVKRGKIEVACLRPEHWLYQLAILEENYRPDELWARRSVFELSGKKLLVNEIFLPTLLWS